MGKDSKRRPLSSHASTVKRRINVSRGNSDGSDGSDGGRFSSSTSISSKSTSQHRYASSTFKIVFMSIYFVFSYSVLSSLSSLTSPSIHLKPPSTHSSLRDASNSASQLLTYLSPFLKPGVSTISLDSLAESWTSSQNLISAPLNYGGESV